MITGDARPAAGVRALSRAADRKMVQNLGWAAGYNVVDIKPGTRYGHRHDAAAVNTILAVVNTTGIPMSFPLLLAARDPEERDPTHQGVRFAGQQPPLEPVDVDAECEALAWTIHASATAHGHHPARIKAHAAEDVGQAYKTSELITLQPGQERFIHSHQL
jgi:hypothetical protein